MAKPRKKGKSKWDKIKAEYIAGGGSYRTLAAKYGVALSSLQRHATKEGWVQLRAQCEVKTDEGLIEAAAKRRAEAAKQFQTLVEGMAGRIEEAIKKADVTDAYSIKMLTGALKDLRELQGLPRSELDKEEQRARIAKLRADAAAKDGADGSDNAIEIRFVGATGEASR